MIQECFKDCDKFSRTDRQRTHGIVACVLGPERRHRGRMSSLYLNTADGQDKIGTQINTPENLAQLSGRAYPA